jgi:hypothetical protein
MNLAVVVVVEGDTDLPIVRKLVADAGLEVQHEIDCGGKQRLDQELSAYNSAARGFPWFVLRDLDRDAPCAGAFVQTLTLEVSRWMCFRLAVREMEAWMLADAGALADFLAVPERLIPDDPDADDDPTHTIVNLARRSRREAIRRAMVPGRGHSASVGPLYEAKLIEFGQTLWSLSRACAKSRSLRRARQRLRELADRWRRYVSST